MPDKIKISSTKAGIHIDLLKNQSNPYPIYKSWREKHSVFQLEPNGYWAVCRHKDVKFALKNVDLFSSEASKEFFQPKWLDKRLWRDLAFLTMNPPEHMKHRKLVDKQFATEAVELLKPFMAKAAHTLISKISPHQEIEFFEEFACPYAGSLMDHIIGTRDSKNLKDLLSQPQQNEQNITSIPDAQTIKKIEKNIRKRNYYFQSIIEKRRVKPEEDLISKLIFAEVDGKKLEDDMISNLAELLLLAGTHGLIHSLCHVMIQLSRQPGLFLSLQQKPELIPAFIEELLRYSTVAAAVLRRTREKVTLSGVTIPKGENVLLFLASANRDPDIFPDPDDFDMSRSNLNEHLAFGFGSHHCLGARLTRTSIQVVLEGILHSFNGISCPPDDQLNWNLWMVNTVEELPVRFI